MGPLNKVTARDHQNTSCQKHIVLKEQTCQIFHNHSFFSKLSYKTRCVCAFCCCCCLFFPQNIPVHLHTQLTSLNLSSLKSSSGVPLSSTSPFKEGGPFTAPLGMIVPGQQGYLFTPMYTNPITKVCFCLLFYCLYICLLCLFLVCPPGLHTEQKKKDQNRYMLIFKTRKLPIYTKQTYKGTC